jgi:hypothetical protein
MKVAQKDPRKLKAHPRNSRVHSGQQIAQIARSIQEFGFLRPVVVDETDTILAGHGAVMAACQVGLKTIPAMVVGELSPRQKEAYVIADNKLSHLSTWDFAMLGEVINDLLVQDFDIDVLGFNEQELDAMLKEDASILPPGFGSSPAPAPGPGREIPQEGAGELVPLGSGIAQTSVPIPKVVFGKYLIPLTAEESERLEMEIKQYVDEYGTLAGFFTRLWSEVNPTD